MRSSMEYFPFGYSLYHYICVDLFGGCVTPIIAHVHLLCLFMGTGAEQR